MLTVKFAARADRREKSKEPAIANNISNLVFFIGASVFSSLFSVRWRWPRFVPGFFKKLHCNDFCFVKRFQKSLSAVAAPGERRSPAEIKEFDSHRLPPPEF